MKKFKYVLVLFVLTLIFIPGNVFAKTKEEAEALLDSMAVENNDGSCTWKFKLTEPEILIDNYCNYSLQDLLKDNPRLENLEEWEQLQVYEDMKENCRMSVVTSPIEVASRKMGNKNWTFGVDFSNGTPDYRDNYDYEVFDQDNLSLTNYYDSIDEYGHNITVSVLKTCSVEILEVDEQEVKKASKIIKKFEANNVIYSLNSFNSVYHYGTIFENNTINSDMILYKFPEFKQSLMENPEFDYEIAWDGGGGMPTETGCAGYVIAYKDDITYGLRYVNFTIDNRLYVDKDLDGTLVERAYNRLNEYFNGKVEIEFDLNVYDDSYMVDGLSGVYTNVKLGNVETPIFIIEVEKKYLDKFEVKAHHKKYNVNVISNSYDVPLDATLQVDDVMKNISLDTNEYKILSAYNIDVVKTGAGSYVKNVENGIDVFIPIAGKEVGEKLKILHMIDDNKSDEEFEGEVVEIDGQHYVKFRTTHFSTYAVAEGTSQISNPNTGDSIIYSILLAFLSICSLFVLYKKNLNFK